MKTMILQGVLQGVWFILPAWACNMMACTFGGGRPIDGGRSFIDGRPLLGKGKTVRGLCVGVSSAVGVAILQSFVIYTVHPIAFGLLLGVGAMLGDIAKSFLKRRLNIESGRPFPPFDQLDFIIGALALYYVVGPYVLSDFYYPSWGSLMVILLLTPFMHLSLNVVGYKLDKKEVWW